MALNFSCSNCGSEVITKYLKTGEVAKCRTCGKDIPIPENAEEIQLTDEAYMKTLTAEKRLVPPVMNNQANGLPVTITKDPTCLDLERQSLEKSLGKPLLAIGLFRRVDQGGFLVSIIGGLAGIAFGTVLLFLLAIIATALNVKSSGGLFNLLVFVAALGAGKMWAARSLRKVKEIPDDFGVMITDEDVYFHGWSFNDKTRMVKLGPKVAGWSLNTVRVKTGDIEMRPASIPGGTATTYAGIGFLLRNQFMFQAQVLSMEVGKEGGNVVYGTENNEAFTFFKALEGHTSG